MRAIYQVPAGRTLCTESLRLTVRVTLSNNGYILLIDNRKKDDIEELRIIEAELLVLESAEDDMLTNARIRFATPQTGRVLPLTVMKPPVKKSISTLVQRGSSPNRLRSTQSESPQTGARSSLNVEDLLLPIPPMIQMIGKHHLRNRRHLWTRHRQGAL